MSYSGFTPLHYAILLDNKEITKLLLDNGADPTLENNRGHIPIDYCTNDNIKLLLEEYTRKVSSDQLISKGIDFNWLTQYEEKKRREELEERRRFPLEDRLKEHIVGQEGPITAAAAAIRRREMGWADDDHPLVLLFLGSSGIGKDLDKKMVFLASICICR